MSTTYYEDITILHGHTGMITDRPVVLSKRDYYCLQYNHAGIIEVQIDAQPPRTVRGPSLLITSPGHDFMFGNHDGWHHSHIGFQGARVARYIESGLLPVAQPLMQIRDSREFLELLGRCVRSWREGMMTDACYQLEGLLLKLHAPSPESNSLPHHDDVRQLAVAMRKTPGEVYELEQEAAWMHISEAHLRRLFKQLIGVSPQRYLLQCRLTACADRLATTRDPIKQIAAEHHFETVHHFTRVFRKQYGLPPGRFRSETLGD